MENANESIRVVCRVRPLNEIELKSGNKSCIIFPPGGASLKLDGKEYTFDKVFQPKATQKEIYELVARPIVEDVLEGYNGTIFAYGQTSCGKTHTMEGKINDPVQQGIIPRITHDIFNHIFKVNTDIEYQIKISSFEIYLEKIRDLLNVSKVNLQVGEDQNHVPYVKGITEKFVSNPEDVFEVIEECKNNRAVAVTNMNEQSSRSHSLFQIQVKQEHRETGKKRFGKLYLVDLAGSEKVGKTGAEGQTLHEAKNINKSLSALGNVINALVDGSSHIPYRDSKLTRILQESLGGNARTTIIICLSPAVYNEAESKSTVMFGSRAKTITNRIQVNEELTAEELQKKFEIQFARNESIRSIIARLEAELKRWTHDEVVPKNEWVVDIPKILETELRKEAAFIETTTRARPEVVSPSEIASVSQLSDGISLLEGGSAKKFTGAPDDLASVPSNIDNEKVSELRKQLEEKDLEISQCVAEIEAVKKSIVKCDADLVEINKMLKQMQDELASLRLECETSKNSVQETLRALEELADNYAQRENELEAKGREIESLKSQSQSQMETIHEKERELARSRETYIHQKSKYTEMMDVLLKDVSEIGEVLNPQLPKPTFEGAANLPEEFTVMRLYISKLKSEAKSLSCKLLQAETQRNSLLTTFKTLEGKLKDASIAATDQNNGLNKLNKKLADYLKRKSELEELLSNLTNDMLVINQQMASSDGTSAIDTKRITEHIASMNEEIKTKSVELETLKKDLAKEKEDRKVICDQLDYLRNKHGDIENNIKEFETQNEKRDQAKQTLKGFEETVFKELQNLQHLRKLFCADLEARIKKASVKFSVLQLDDMSAEFPEDAQSKGVQPQTEKIAYLNDRLAQLTNNHKELVDINASLRLELPKMERRLKATTDVLKNLEAALKLAKDETAADKIRYQHEVERIKETLGQKTGSNRLGRNAQIAKPLRGQLAKTVPPLVIVEHSETEGSSRADSSTEEN